MKLNRRKDRQRPVPTDAVNGDRGRVYEVLVAKLNAARVRRETLHGREYLVVPTTILRPDSVLNGSKGPLFYPAAEVARNVGAWNGMPLLLNHPSHGATGRSPQVVGAQGMGYIYNDRVVKSGARVVDAWFDVELTKAHDRDLPDDRRVLPRLEGGAPVDVSTGLFTDETRVRNRLRDARTPAKTADVTTSNYRPDHLAVLPLVRGACSADDGCGAGVTGNDNPKGINQYTKGGGHSAHDVKGLGVPLMQSHQLGSSAAAAGKTPKQLEEMIRTQRLGPKAAKRVRKAYEEQMARNARKRKPSAGLDMSSAKACKILHDRKVNGHPLTEAQRGMFGAKCGKSGHVKNADGTCETCVANSNPEGCNQYKGCGVGGGKSIRESHTSTTPAVKAALKTVEQGPLSYVTGMSHGEALAEVAKVRAIHTESLAHLSSVAAGKSEPGGTHHTDWQHAQAKHGRVLSASEWATKLGVPGKEGYLKELDHTEKAIKLLQKKTKKSARTDDDSTTNEDGPMRLSDASKRKAVKFLTTNCDCWMDKAAALNVLEDDALRAVYAQAKDLLANREAVAATREVLGIAEDDEVVFNAEFVKGPDMKKKMKAACAPDEEVEVVKKNSAKVKADDDDEDEADLDATVKAAVDAAVKDHPAVKNGERITRRERAKLVTKLTAVANAKGTPAPKKAMILNKLKATGAAALGVEDLEELLVLVDAPATNADDDGEEVFDSRNPYPRNTRPHADYTNGMPEYTGAGGGGRQGVNNSDLDEPTENDALAKYDDDASWEPRTDWDAPAVRNRMAGAGKGKGKKYDLGDE